MVSTKPLKLQKVVDDYEGHSIENQILKAIVGNDVTMMILLCEKNNANLPIFVGQRIWSPLAIAYSYQRMQICQVLLYYKPIMRVPQDPKEPTSIVRHIINKKNDVDIGISDENSLECFRRLWHDIILYIAVSFPYLNTHTKTIVICYLQN